jgi:Phytanoyl-CoA dioxygenase (PhyH)
MTDPTSLFPGVPLVESPVFGSLLDRMDLTDSERRIASDLNRNGYAIFDFPDPDLDARIDRIRARLGPELGIDDLDPAAVKTNGPGRIQDAWQYDEDVRAIAANEAVTELLSKLYGRRAFPFQTLNFPVGTQQHVHTDTVHFSSVPERFMCGVWLAMEDVEAGAGPLCYVPGSHKWPIISNAMIGRRAWQQDLEHAQAPYHDAWVALMAEHQRPLEQFLPRKGEALIWCANLLHGGSPQSDPTRTRWSQVTHYFFEDCIYYTPALSDESLGRLALRQIVNAADGTSKPNIYLGEEIREPDPPKKRWWDTLRPQGKKRELSNGAGQPMGSAR